MQRFLVSLTKLETGHIRVGSFAFASEIEVSKLHFIFSLYAGQQGNFRLFFDEFQTKRIPLSQLEFSARPVSTMEEATCRKLNLLEGGILTPIELIAEFEAQMGDILLDEQTMEFYLEGQKRSE